MPQIALFAARGWQVELVTSQVPAHSVIRRTGGLRLIEIPMTRAVSPLRDAWGFLRWWQYLRRSRPDVLLASTPKASLLGLLSARLAGVTCRVYHVRGLRLEGQTGLRRRLGRLTERLSIAAATAVVCDSPSLLLKMHELGIMDGSTGTVLGSGSACGVDVTKFHPVSTDSHSAHRDEPMAIGFVGRVCRDKGVPELLEAVTTLHSAGAQVTLTIVGDIEEPEVLPEGNPGDTVDSWLRIEGRRSDVDEVLRGFDVFCLPTHREGLPIAMLEAMATGLPVVATNATGCRDIVDDGINGLLVPVSDVTALTEALLRLVEDVDLRTHLGKNARESVRRDFPDHVVNSRFVDFVENECSRMGVRVRARGLSDE